MANFQNRSIDACNGNALGHAGGCKGLCSRHYMRLKRHGSPIAGRTATGAIDAWVAALIERNPTECVAWPFAKTERGYGKIRRGGIDMLAGRFVCIVAHGEPQSEGLEAAHACGMGHLACVTPSHLSWKTVAENEADKLLHGTATIGERNAAARLSTEEASDIVASSESPRALSERYGVSASHIMKIKTGERWKHLQRETRV